MNPNPKPEVVTNRAGDDTANALTTYWSHLLGALREPPDLAIATAYFNAAGFSVLADPLERMQRVRLLIGAEPDVAAELRRVRPLRQDLLPDDVPRERVRVALSEHERDLATDRDLDPFDPEVDATSKRLIAWLRSGRVEVRRLTDRFLHGKAYIVETAHDGVVAGSSNLTFAGLKRNDELNLGHYQPHVVGEVVSWFEALWGAAQPFDLAALYERRFEPHDPHVVYLRMLWERYRGEIDCEQPRGGLQLTAFQRDGLYRALDYLERHAGVLIADGVGLGKTYLAGELIRRTAQELRQRVVIIAPAALRDGPWERFLREFDLKGVQCLSYQELAADPRLGGHGETKLWYEPDEYALVVIDEAHAYRHPGTDRAKTLRALLEGSPRKRVVLLTATPVNNSLWDLYHLLSYFIRNDSQFLSAGIPSLRAHFAAADAHDPEDLTPDALFDVLDAVAVRRTRRFIKRFYPYERIRKGDIETTITFPQPVVKRVDYDLGALPEFFARFLHALGVDPTDDENPLPSPTELEYGEQLTLARYAPSAYALGDGAQAFELQAAGLLRSGLLKRFESSVHAFASTCRTMARSHDTFLAALDDGWVLTGDALTAYAKTDSDDFDPSDIEGGRKDHASDYDLTRLRTAVTADRDLLLEFAATAESVTAERDEKLDALIEELAAIAKEAKQEATDPVDERDKRKVLVFSYFADTVHWIEQRLRRAVQTDPRLEAYRDRLASTTGSSDDTTTVLTHFAPVSSDAPANTEDRYDLLVTTDVLAEGVNLQQARHIINYDLPWNPMRLVQRHGRIDRIGSPHARVYLRCFFPSRDLDALLKLEHTIQRKITKAARSIGVEGEIIPGSAATDTVFTHSQERIQQLLHERADMFEEALDTGALSGEEFRLELERAFRDPSVKQRVTGLPWASGSAKLVSASERAGYVFCARVANDPLPRYRFVPDAPGAGDDADDIIRDTLGCFSAAVTTHGTPNVMTDAVRSGAYAAWRAARSDILTEWQAGTDPRNLRPAIPKAMRDAAELVRKHPPTGLASDALYRLLDTLEAPYDLRTQRLFRNAMTTHEAPTDKVRAIVELVDELGLEPPEPIEPLPEIVEDDVHLVCWMALVSPEEGAPRVY